ncbi:MAG: PIN domain-containing protein [Microthrixaceae bacterium]|nr:PIN domain-containing protein [Microthrixaceae bacterium]
MEPTPDHPGILRRLLGQVGAGANLVNDAHLAALAIEHRCAVVSYDNDFSRFDGVVWERPEGDDAPLIRPPRPGGRDAAIRWRRETGPRMRRLRRHRRHRPRRRQREDRP